MSSLCKKKSHLICSASFRSSKLDLWTIDLRQTLRKTILQTYPSQITPLTTKSINHINSSVRSQIIEIIKLIWWINLKKHPAYIWWINLKKYPAYGSDPISRVINVAKSSTACPPSRRTDAVAAQSRGYERFMSSDCWDWDSNIMEREE